MHVILGTILGGLFGAIIGVAVMYYWDLRHDGDTFFAMCVGLSFGLRPGILCGAILGCLLSQL